MDKAKIVTGQKITQKKLERAKELRREMTPAERRLWQRLRANRLEGWHFRRQQIIAGFIVDFYCHKAGLVIEIDGPIHQQQEIEDKERTQVLVDLGLKVIRFNNCQVMNHLDQVLESILDSLNTDSPSRVGKGLGDGLKQILNIPWEFHRSNEYLYQTPLPAGRDLRTVPVTSRRE